MAISSHLSSGMKCLKCSNNIIKTKPEKKQLLERQKKSNSKRILSKRKNKK
ncbi:hypothetical protein VN0420_14910 [Helicobacter pylori]|nr:hypothetical protein VN0420_14910 [Helicobacter pylori]